MALSIDLDQAAVFVPVAYFFARFYLLYLWLYVQYPSHWPKVTVWWLTSRVLISTFYSNVANLRATWAIRPKCRTSLAKSLSRTICVENEPTEILERWRETWLFGWITVMVINPKHCLFLPTFISFPYLPSSLRFPSDCLNFLLNHLLNHAVSKDDLNSREKKRK